MSKPPLISDPVGDVKLGRELLAAAQAVKMQAMEQGEPLIPSGLNLGQMVTLQNLDWVCVALAKAYTDHVPSVYQLDADLCIMATMLTKPWPALISPVERMMQSKLLKKVLQALRKKWRNLMYQGIDLQSDSVPSTLQPAFMALAKSVRIRRGKDGVVKADGSHDIWALAGLDSEDEDDEGDDGFGVGGSMSNDEVEVISPKSGEPVADPVQLVMAQLLAARNQLTPAVAVRMEISSDEDATLGCSSKDLKPDDDASMVVDQKTFGDDAAKFQDAEIDDVQKTRGCDAALQDTQTDVLSNEKKGANAAELQVTTEEHGITFPSGSKDDAVDPTFETLGFGCEGAEEEAPEVDPEVEVHSPAKMPIKLKAKKDTLI